MLNPEFATITFVLLALIIFAFIYWRDATAEGFSSDKIFDSFFIILFGALLGGKLLFRELNFDYFRYQFFTSPLIFEGILIGGGISAYFITKRNHWDGWKIGDMIAPALSMFQVVLFLGFYIKTRELSYALLFFGFIFLSSFISSLKKKKHFGTSSRYFEFKRLNRLTFTGGLLATYLTGSSLIAMLFLLAHPSTQSWFWWNQIIFYILVLVSSYYLIRRKLIEQGIKMNPILQLSDLFVQKVKKALSFRRKQIGEDIKAVRKNDPFTIEAEEGHRNLDALGDEVQDFQQHGINEAVVGELKEEKKEIDKALKNIEKGKYGYCVECGKMISESRLKAYPTATTCANCENKSN